MTIFYVTSTNQQKINTVKKVLRHFPTLISTPESYPHVVAVVKGIDCSTELNPPQPSSLVNGHICALNRINIMKQKIEEQNLVPGFIVSLENCITDGNHDVCVAYLLTPNGKLLSDHSSIDEVTFPDHYLQKAKTNSYNSLGYQVTIGSLIHEDRPDIHSNNWMAHQDYGKIERESQMFSALYPVIYTLVYFK